MGSLIAFEWHGLVAPLAGGIGVLLFLLPGVACSLLVRVEDAWDRLVFALVASCLLGYVAFWVYLGNYQAGRGFTVVTMLLSIAVVARWGITQRDRLGGEVWLRGLGCQVGVVVLYLATMNLAPFTGGQGELANLYFFPQWGDNAFQATVAERLFRGESVRQFDGWPTLLERPPLQAGLLLLSGVPFLGSALWLDTTGMAINASWVLAVLWLGHKIGLGRASTGRVLVLCLGVGFLFNSTVFAWPKMLAGTLVTVGASLWWFSGRPTPQPMRLGVGIAAWGCAWLAHPTSGFAIGLALVCGVVVLVRLARAPGPLPFATLISLGLCLGWLLIPWRVYQNVLGGSPDTLLKYHLAGEYSSDVDESPISAIRTGYAEAGGGEIAGRKWNNLKALFGPSGDYGDGSIDWRRSDYYHLFHALGVLNLGWLIWWRSRASRREPVPPESHDLAVLAGGAGVVLVTWIALQFGPTAAEVEL